MLFKLWNPCAVCEELNKTGFSERSSTALSAENVFFSSSFSL